MADMRQALAAGNVPRITELYYQMFPNDKGPVECDSGAVLKAGGAPK